MDIGWLVAEEHKHLSGGWCLEVRCDIRFDHAASQSFRYEHCDEDTTDKAHTLIERVCACY